MNIAEKSFGPRSEPDSFKFSVQVIARHFGRPTSLDVLFSSIPLSEGNIDLENIERIAERIGLTVNSFDTRKIGSGEFELPSIIELKNGEFVTLLATVTNQKFASIVTQNNPTPRNIKFSELEGLNIVKGYSFSLLYLNNEERVELGGLQKIERAHWLSGTLLPFWRGYVNVAVATMFINMMALASPIFVMNVYDRILPNKATSSLLALALGVGLALFFDLLLKYCRSGIIDYTGREADQKISYVLFDKVLHSSLIARPSSTGEYANRISQFEFVREFFTSNTIATLIDAAFVFVFLFVIYLVAGWLYLIPLTAFIMAVIVGFIAQYRIGRRVARAANETAQRQSLLVEAISSIETVKILKSEETLIRKWNELTKNGSRTSQQIKQLSSGATNTTQFVQQLVTVLIVIAGAYEFAEGNLTTGAIIATVMLSGRTVAPLTQISLTLARFKQAILSLKILNNVMDQPEDRPSSIGFVNREIMDGSFSFQDVEFQYPGSDAVVLKGLNLTVRAGERVGIIGKIGSGKTTIGRMLSVLYQAQKGRLSIDGIDIRQYHSATVRSAVAVAGQTVDLFSGTLKENLQLGNLNSTDDEIVAAAKKTGVDEFAAQHPRGYDLAVGEHGNNLSGGQKQAVAITRLLLGDPQIIFLDEPSGAMDLATEKQLMRTLSGAFEPHVTLVIATHRYSLLELVDRLVVLDQGRVIADGPKDKVLQELTRRSVKQTQ